MPIQLIDKIKQKNNGTFKLVDAADIEWGEFKVPVENLGFDLQAATKDVLGGVKIGENIHVADDGTISVHAQVTDDHINALIAAGIIEKADATQVSIDIAQAKKDVADEVAKTYATKQELTDSAYELPQATSEALGGVYGAEAKLSDAALGTVKFKKTVGMVLTELAANSVDANQISDGAITAAKLSNDVTNTIANKLDSSVAEKTYATKTELSDSVKAALTSAITPKGSIAFASLPEPTADALGNMYNVTDSFTTTDKFVEGAGKAYGPGANVLVVKSDDSYKWDVQGGFVDLSGYQPLLDVTTNNDIDSMF